MRAIVLCRGYRHRATARRDDRCESRPHHQRVPRSRRARRPVPGRALHVPRVRRRGRPRGACAARARPRDRGPGRHLEPELRRVGRVAVRDRQGRRDPRQHQPGLSGRTSSPTSSSSRGAGCLFAATEFKTSDYRAMVDEVAPDLAAARAGRVPRYAGLGCVRRGARARSMPTPSPGGRPSSAFDDPINIQYTSGTTGFPKGATLSHHNILNNGYFVGEVCGYTEADRVCIPVPLYHCFGMVLGNLACTTHGAAMVLPAPGFEPRRDARDGRGRTVHEPVRRADDVHRRARSRRLRRRSTCRRCARGSWPARRARSR